MTVRLKQSTAATIVLGSFQATDGTVQTALSLAQADVRLSKNGGTFAQKNDTTAPAHMENGFYSVVLNATDTGTLGRLKVAVNKTGAMPAWLDCEVVPANVYESLITGVEFLETTGLKPDFTVAGGVLTVKKTDGSTTQYTKTVGSTTGADPITSLD